MPRWVAPANVEVHSVKVKTMPKFKNVFLDISGVCNADCPYCLSGRYRKSGAKFMAVDVFDHVLKQLTALQLINADSMLGLYNWGEPFLHPQLNEILRIANGYAVQYQFSTNASVIPVVDDSFVKGLRGVSFSMSGFSQGSYDRIHGFSLTEILKNIVTIVERCRVVGYRGALSVNYHVYQFNLHEISLCEEFCNKYKITLQLNYAILNHWDHIWAYVENTLPYDMLKNVSQDLFCCRLRELCPETKSDYRCPQYDLLAIDEDANVLLCCQVSKDEQYFAGNILKDDFDSILQRRENNAVCAKCVERGMARYLNTALPFPRMGRPVTGSMSGIVRRICRRMMRW